MFEGVSDQFHQFSASRTTTSPLPLPLSFPSLHYSSSSSSHHHHHNNFFAAFDHPYPTPPPPPPQHVPLPPNFLHPLHQSPPQATASQNDEEDKEDEDDDDDDDDNNNNMAIGVNLEVERERLLPQSVDPWSNEEVLALLRIRSGFEIWFPEFTWDHVSRKLAEVGFKRSAEKCKEKFEEESRYFNNINYSKNNYRAFSELDELYHGDQSHSHHEEVAAKKNAKEIDKPSKGEGGKEEKDKMQQTLEEIDSRKRDNGREAHKSVRSKKRKREEKVFEMFKSFCEDVVRKMMAQQEEMHNKLLEDMIKRDEEKVAREEAWKKQEMDKINKELEVRARDQALAGDRQATIIKFLKKFTSSSSSDLSLELVYISTPSTTTSSSLPLAQNPSHSSQSNNQNSNSLPSKNNPILPSSLSQNQPPQNPSPTPAKNIQKIPTSSTTLLAPQNPNSKKPQNDTSPTPKSSSTTLSTQQAVTKSTTTTITSNDKEGIGKRWPRDEVLALVNLRCSLYNSNEDREGAANSKAPLWERISQGMLELGYKRSAKRCKEKWENINKYFRKTKDINKKRSLDSRTCPYFHQLSTLYSQGTLSLAPEKRPDSAENRPALPETGQDSSSKIGSSNSRVYNVVEGEKNMVHVPGFEFEF